MNSNEFFNMQLKKGEYGEKIIIPQLPWACKCWRYDKTNYISYNGKTNTETFRQMIHVCHNMPKLLDVTKDEALWGPYDVDAKLIYNCADCPVYELNNYGREDKDKAIIEEWHEIKTNYATHKEEFGKKKKKEVVWDEKHGRNITRTTYEDAWLYGTQNIYIELISNVDSYDGVNCLTFERDGETIKIPIGIGWWNKNGDKKDDWYHFFQPIADGFLTPTVVKKDIVRKWLDDKSVPDGAMLITKWPFSCCISITGEHIKKMIKEGNYNDPVIWVDNGGKWVKQQAVLIPIADVVPCIAYNKQPVINENGVAHTPITQNEEVENLGRFYDPTNVKTFIAGDSFVVKGEEGQVGNMDLLYIPQALYKEAFQMEYIGTEEGGSDFIYGGATNTDWHYYKEEGEKKHYTYAESILMPKLLFDEVARAIVY